MKEIKIFKCPKCVKNKKGSLKKINKGFVCKNCDEFYPVYCGYPVIMSFEEDFYHLKKALSPAKYRVHKYED